VACPCEVTVWGEAKVVESPASTSNDGMAAAAGEAGTGPDSEAVVAFTSGSSGRPKPVLISQCALIAGLWNMMLAGAWTAKRNRKLEEAPARPAGGQPSSLLVAPLTHVGGYSHFLLSLATGSRTVITSSWNPARMAGLACREDAKSLVGATPRMILEILDMPMSGSAVLPIESFGVHGSALRKGLMDEVRKRVPDARFSTGYGLTETSGSIAATGGAELLLVPETCGPVLPTVEIEILDEEGKARSPGNAGEIRIRGAMLFDGYYGSAPHSGEKGSLDWFLTGDIGVLDQHRYLTLLERGSATIRLGSRGLYCSDIEKYIDDGQWGDEIVAVGADEGQQLVIGVLSRQRVDARKLKLQLEHEFRIPGDRITIVCRSELPRTSSGKIDRRALVALSAEAMTDLV
jgi:long-chain acyl-CoA synthetase